MIEASAQDDDPRTSEELSAEGPGSARIECVKTPSTDGPGSARAVGGHADAAPGVEGPISAHAGGSCDENHTSTTTRRLDCTQQRMCSSTTGRKPEVSLGSGYRDDPERYSGGIGKARNSQPEGIEAQIHKLNVSTGQGEVFVCVS